MNPASGQETAIGHLPAINARLREAGDVDIVLTTGEGDGVEAGRRAALEGYDRVGAAEFHLVILQCFSADPGNHSGRVDDNDVGGLAGWLDMRRDQ